MELHSASRWWCLMAVMVCLHDASAHGNVLSQSSLLAAIKQVVTEVLREHDAEQVHDHTYRCNCSEGFIPCAGRCYARLHGNVEYDQAELQCTQLGGHLAVPRSRDQNLCVAGLAGQQHVWLGITDREEEGVFKGADGRLMTGNEGQVWGGGQPDNAGGNENCVEIWPRGGSDFAEWNDWGCTGARAFPMCQLL